MAINVIDTYSIRLRLDTSAVDKQLGKAKKKIEGLGKTVEKKKIGMGMSKAGGIGAMEAGALGMGAGKIGAKGLGIGAGVLAAVGALRKAREETVMFNTAQTRAATAFEATTDQAKALEKQSRELGRTTIFTAMEVAQAQEMLGKNGIKFQQVMDGMVESTLNLSGALQTDLSSSANLVASAIDQFGLKASDSERVVNALSGAAANSKAQFRDLRLAFAQGGGAAGKLGVEFEDFVTAITGTISAFGSGSDAGTAYKTFLTRLVPTSKQAVELQKQLGLEFFDSAGSMKDMASITGQLNKAFTSLTEEERTFAAKQLFGDDAMRFALSLASMTKEEFEALGAEVNSISAASKALGQLGVEERNIRLLNSALTELRIKVGKELGISKLFDTGTVALTGFVNLLNSIPPDMIKVGASLIGLRLGFKLLGRVMRGKFFTSIGKTTKAMLALGGRAGAIGLVRSAVVGLARLALGSNPLGWLVTAGILVYQYWEKIPKLFDWVGEKIEYVAELAKEAATAVSEALSFDNKSLKDMAEGVTQDTYKGSLGGGAAVDSYGWQSYAGPGYQPTVNKMQENNITNNYKVDGGDISSVREASRRGIDEALANVGAE